MISSKSIPIENKLTQPELLLSALCSLSVLSVSYLCPMRTDLSFSDLNLNNPLLRALADMGLENPTAIQHAAFSPIMAGKDVLGIAQTGTGKTFAYLMPLIRLWKFSKKPVPEILIVVPTRELAVQVADEFSRLAAYTAMKITPAYGGANIKSQALEIYNGTDVVVATPGRLLDLVLDGTIKAKNVKKLVIDEVDEMLNLGFRAQLTTLIDLLPEKRQNLMFSATLNTEVEEWMEQHFPPMMKVEASPSGKPLDTITQYAYHVPNFNTKINLLQHLLHHDASMTKVLVFAGSKKHADDIHFKMDAEFNDQIAIIHSNKSQNNRFRTVEQFEEGVCRILIASDVIARGLDVSGVSHVINMDVPDEPEHHLHRIGRTGRATQKGIAITFYADYETEFLHNIESLMGLVLPVHPLPSDLEISNVLIPDETPKVKMKIIQLKPNKDEQKGDSFHDKKEKNKKIPIKVTRADRKKAKYGKNYDPRHGS